MRAEAWHDMAKPLYVWAPRCLLDQTKSDGPPYPSVHLTYQAVARGCMVCPRRAGGQCPAEPPTLSDTPVRLRLEGGL